MNRFDGSDIQILFTRLPGPTSLRVYHEQLQPAQRNLCTTNRTCSQFCLPIAMMRKLLWGIFEVFVAICSLEM
jgi:putative component of membrane protein insertase Oxa1/YidC/SpoIIIJ protein YidD